VTTAADILKSKPDQIVHSIAPTASVYDALVMMSEKRVGALLAVHDGRIVGIITERDYARKIALMSRLSKETEVREIMTSAVMFVSPSQTTEECMALMTENRLRHLPVMEGDRLLGMVSIGDLVKGIISEQKFIIAQLEHYITGARA
jgi:CBS domain-containing protein